MTTPRKDYLNYLKSLTDGQYGSDEEVDVPDTTDSSWIWAESPAKEKMKNVVFNGVVDAIDLRKEQIKGALAQAKNIQVGEFILQIRNYYGPEPLLKGTLSFKVLQRKTKTPTGQPCNMDLPADLSKDNRFTGRPWMSYFNGTSARDMPIDTVVEVVRWMQALKRMKAFL